MKKNLRVIVDECSGCGSAEWFQKKSGMIEPTTKLFHQWQKKGYVIDFVRCDIMLARMLSWRSKLLMPSGR